MNDRTNDENSADEEPVESLTSSTETLMCASEEPVESLTSSTESGMYESEMTLSEDGQKATEMTLCEDGRKAIMDDEVPNSILQRRMLHAHDSNASKLTKT